MLNKIYFDNNSIPPISAESKSAMLEVMSLPLNPSATHSHGRFAKKILEESRDAILSAMNLSKKEYNLVFTSSGTEANNLCIKGLKDKFQAITTSIEHASVLNNVGEGIISVDKDCVIVNYESLIKPNSLVSVMYANNETGAIQPIQELVNIAHQNNAIFHTDAAQAFGKIETNFNNIDLITISSHKLGGPLGVAALVFKKNLPLIPISVGGGQEMRFRSGTHNLPAICGFAAACKNIDRSIENYKKLERLRNLLESEILKICKDVIIFGGNAKRLPNVSNISMPNVNSTTQVIHFDSKGFSVSSGSACSSGVAPIPRVQLAMGYKEQDATTAIRISLGPQNTESEVLSFVKEWKQLYFNTNKVN